MSSSHVVKSGYFSRRYLEANLSNKTTSYHHTPSFWSILLGETFLKWMVNESLSLFKKMSSSKSEDQYFQWSEFVCWICGNKWEEYWPQFLQLLWNGFWILYELCRSSSLHMLFCLCPSLHLSLSRKVAVVTINSLLSLLRLATTSAVSRTNRSHPLGFDLLHNSSQECTVTSLS